MSSFIYFFQRKGVSIILTHMAIGMFITCVLTITGVVLDRFQVLGGLAARVCFWQSYLLWSALGSGFVERYEHGQAVYAGIPYVLVWLIGIFSGIPIYSFVSMLVHFGISAKTPED